MRQGGSTSLEQLGLSGCGGLSADVLAALAAPSLRVLQVAWCGAATDAALHTAARRWQHSLQGGKKNAPRGVFIFLNGS